MIRASAPPAGSTGAYAVPLPRHTDAAGETLRRAYRCPGDEAPAALASLLARLR